MLIHQNWANVLIRLQRPQNGDDARIFYDLLFHYQKNYSNGIKEPADSSHSLSEIIGVVVWLIFIILIKEGPPGNTTY